MKLSRLGTAVSDQILSFSFARASASEYDTYFFCKKALETMKYPGVQDAQVLKMLSAGYSSESAW